MDITPLIKEGMNIITSYGNMGFGVNKTKYEGSIFLLPSAVIAVPSLDLDNLDHSLIDLIIHHHDHLELLLIGCGLIHRQTPASLKEKLKTHRIACDTMTTGASCRTYNVLLSEERKVGALLMAV